MIWAVKINSDENLFLLGELVEPEKVLLCLQAPITPHLELPDLLSQPKSLILQDDGGFRPGTAGKVVVVGLHGQKVDEKAVVVALDVHTQIAHLQPRIITLCSVESFN